MTSSSLRATLLLLLFASSCSSACKTLPTGAGGSDADALAHKAEAWVNKDAWDKTGAVKFGFRDAHQLTWDKEHGFVDVKNGDVDVQLDLWDKGGFAQKKGEELAGEDKQKALEKAYALFCNDTFWLNPLVKLFDQGTTREIVDVDGQRGLKITYKSGGVTPGDSYVWTIADDGQPVSVRMWVSVLPVKGMQVSWDGWQTLPTGAKVATNHKAVGIDHAVTMVDVQGAATAKELGIEDTFKRLVERRPAPG